MTLLTFYAADSGGGDRLGGITLAGYVGEPRCWELLGRGWRRVLNQPPGGHKPIARFRGSDGNALQGEFEGWTGEEADEFRVALARQIDLRLRFGVSVSVVTEDYEKNVLPGLPSVHLFRNPYVWCLQRCLEYIINAKERRGARVRCVFDEDLARKCALVGHYQQLRDAGGWSRHLMKTASSDDATRVISLQTADFLASESCRETNRYERDRLSLGTFSHQIPIYGVYFNGRALQRLAIHLPSEDE